VVQPLKTTVLNYSFQWCRVKNSILKIAYRVTKIANHHKFLAHPVYCILRENLRCWVKELIRNIFGFLHFFCKFCHFLVIQEKLVQYNKFTNQ